VPASTPPDPREIELAVFDQTIQHGRLGVLARLGVDQRPVDGLDQVDGSFEMPQSRLLLPETPVASSQVLGALDSIERRLGGRREQFYHLARAVGERSDGLSGRDHDAVFAEGDEDAASGVGVRVDVRVRFPGSSNSSESPVTNTCQVMESGLPGPKTVSPP